MRKSIYIILTLFFMAVTTGFTVRQPDCRTDMGSMPAGHIAPVSGENHSACHLDHVTLFQLDLPFFGTDVTRVPEVFPNNTTGKKKEVPANINSYINTRSYATPAIFGSFVIRDHNQAQSAICEYLI